MGDWTVRSLCWPELDSLGSDGYDARVGLLWLAGMLYILNSTSLVDGVRDSAQVTCARDRGQILQEDLASLCCESEKLGFDSSVY